GEGGSDQPEAGRQPAWHDVLLSFDSGGGDAPDQVALAGEEEAEDRTEGDQRHREQRAPGGLALRVDEQPQGERDRGEVRVGQEDELAVEVVPRPDEREDGGGGQRRQRQRHDDPPEDAPVVAAVDAGGLVQLPRQDADELHHEEDEERVGGEELRDDQ